MDDDDDDDDLDDDLDLEREYDGDRRRFIIVIIFNIYDFIFKYYKNIDKFENYRLNISYYKTRFYQNGSK